VAVMYLGRIVEEGTTDELFQTPRHPYTQALIASIPRADSNARSSLQNAQRLAAGDLPSLLNPPSGCAYRTRCAYAQESCSKNTQTLREVPGASQRVACDRWEQIQAGEQIKVRR
jgi:peptide/nickel transport system ATP-binding protein/oligopeptide transport system ATP-binding protein